MRSKRMTRELTTARTFSSRGADYLQKKNFSEAGPLFNEALDFSDADERAHWGLAEVLWKEGNAESAIRHMSRAIELSGSGGKKPSDEWQVRLGEMYLDINDLDGALGQAEIALAHDRKYAPAWELKGRVLQKRNRLNDALDCYCMAMIHRPNHRETQIALADVYQSLGRPQSALRALDQLVEDQPTEALPARAWLLKGQALAALGEGDEAITCLAQATNCVQEDETDVLVELAEIQFASGKLGEARYCVGLALKQKPFDVGAKSLQATIDRSFDEFARQSTIAAQPAHWQRKEEN